MRACFTFRLFINDECVPEKTLNKKMPHFSESSCDICDASVHMFSFIYSCCWCCIFHGFESFCLQFSELLWFYCCSILVLLSVELSLCFQLFASGSSNYCHVNVQAVLPVIKLCQPQTLPAINNLIDLLGQLSVTVSVHTG